MNEPFVIVTGAPSGIGLELDLATIDGADRLWRAAAGRPVDALPANAVHRLVHGFSGRDFADVRHVAQKASA